MSRNSLSGSQSQHLSEQNVQGDTFIFSEGKSTTFVCIILFLYDLQINFYNLSSSIMPTFEGIIIPSSIQKVNSKDDLEDEENDLNLLEDSYGLDEDNEDNYDENYNEEDQEYMSDQLQPFEDDQENEDEEFNIEESAEQFYFGRLKKKVLVTLYQYCQEQYMKKSMIAQIVQKQQVKQCLYKWSSIVKEMSSNIQQSQQQDFNLQGGQEQYEDQQDDDLQMYNNYISNSLLCKANNNDNNEGNSPILIKDMHATSIESSQDCSSQFENEQSMKSQSFTQENSQQCEVEQEERMKVSNRNFNENNQQNQERFFSQNNKCSHNNSLVGATHQEKESQKINQDSNEKYYSEIKNYNSPKQINFNKFAIPIRDSSQKQINEKDNNTSNAVSQGISNVNDSNNEKEISNQDLNYQEYQYAEKDMIDIEEFKLEDVNIQEIKELQVEQSIYDEKSMELLSTKRDHILSQTNLQSMSVSKRNQVLVTQFLPSDNEKSYRKEQTIKLSNSNQQSPFANFIEERQDYHSSRQKTNRDHQKTLNPNSQLDQLFDETILRKNGQQDEQQLIVQREECFTQRNSLNTDRRLQQIESYSISKNIELTPTQQYMIVSSRGNHGQSVSEELQEQQEQAEYDLAHEVAYYIFGRKLFHKLRLAYHLTQYNSNELLRLQQEKIMTLRQYFDRLKELKAINMKKRAIQDKLFKYYELRYIRRPLKKWHENNKIFKAQKISLFIVANAMLKSLSSVAFQKIAEFAQQKKKEQTVNNLLKFYERQSSLARGKCSLLEKEKIAKKQKQERSEMDREDKGGYRRQRKEDMPKSYELEHDNSDKENNINIDNVQNTFFAAAGWHQKKEQNYSKLNDGVDKQQISSDNAQTDDITYPKQKRPNHNTREQSSISEYHSSNTSPSLTNCDNFQQSNFHYQQQKPFKDVLCLKTDNSITNQRKTNNLSNFQSIQSTALGHYISTEVSDNDVNNHHQKISCQYDSTTSQFDEIYNLINDRSSMVFKNYKNQQNRQQISQNSARSSSSYSPINQQQNLVIAQQQQQLLTDKCAQSQSQFHLASSTAPNTYLNEKQKNIDIQVLQSTESPKQNQNLLLSMANNYKQDYETGKGSIRVVETATERNHNQSYLKDNEMKQQLIKIREGSQQPSNNYNRCQTEENTNEEDVHSKKQQRSSPQFSSSRNNLNVQDQSQSPLKNYVASQNKIQFPNKINCPSTNSPLTLSPIPRIASIQSSQSQNNQQSQQNYLPHCNHLSTSRDNTDALSFTQSQIKNSLNVSQSSNLLQSNQAYLASQNMQKVLPQNEQNSSQIISSSKNDLVYNNSSSSHREAGKIKCNLAQQNSNNNRSFIEHNSIHYNNSITQNQDFVKGNAQEIIKLNSGVSYIRNKKNEENKFQLVSYVDRTNSSNRLNQQLEFQAHAFNLRKSQSKEISSTNRNLINSYQNVDSKNQHKTSFSSITQALNNDSFSLNQQSTCAKKQKQDLNASQISKPPLQIKSSRILDHPTPSSSSQTQRDIKKQTLQSNDLIESKGQEVQKMHEVDSHLGQAGNNRIDNGSYTNRYFTKASTDSQRSKQIQSSRRADSSFEEKPLTKAKEQSLDRINSFYTNNNDSEFDQNLHRHTNKQNLKNTNLNYYNSNSNKEINRSFQQNQVLDNSAYNKQMPQQAQQEQTVKQQRNTSITNEYPSNYINHIKNKELSQNILDAASSISQQQQLISKKKQEQINQLKQYQNYKQIQTQKQQQQQQSNNTSFSQINESKRRDSHSRNVSYETKKKHELTNVGQNIQNILYFEAKIRSKRIARSQERMKNDSMELCQKLENLESYIQQINNDIVQEKEKRNYLLDENQQLLHKRDKDSRIY